MSPPRMPAENISIHAAREGGDRYADYVTQAQVISIHAAREGGDDNANCPLPRSVVYFNPRRP